MECTGRLHSVNRDWKSGKIIISFELNEEPTEGINAIGVCEKLNISAKKYREKRSLDANGYCWAIITKIANHPEIKSSKEEIYEEMLQKYGYIYQDDDGYISMTIKADADISKIPGHWKFIKTNGTFTSYLMIKGSSEYDTSEMAHFIDMVVQEAKELGIETLTPAELERMKIEWRKD
jgi:hypothetical protein